MTAARWALCLVGLVGCLSSDPLAGGSSSDDGTDSPGVTTSVEADFDAARAQAKFVTTTDLMRYVVAPTCAAQNNECHNNEDFPDMSTEGNLFNLVGLACNQGLGERTEVEDFCEAAADEVMVGAQATRIGAITTALDEAGEFVAYELTLEDPLSAAVDGATFTILRAGTPRPELGTGDATQGDAGSRVLTIQDATSLPAPTLIRQGDENGNGHFGDGSGALIVPGDARGSYLVRRLFGEQTNRPRMPLNENADNPTETNRPLEPDAAYALMSWINCFQSGDEPYAAIRYDCPNNAGNEGTW